MRELSLHILDIVENSVKANAKLIEVNISAYDGVLKIEIRDNGKGMSEDFLKKVCDPFTTTRTTRKVGMGIPLFMQATKDAEGSFEITSKLGVGTTVVATFKLDSIDRAPLGDLVSTILTQLDDNVDFVWNYEINGKTFTFDTRELKMELDGISVCSPEVVAFVKDLLTENIETVNGGMML